MDDVKSQRMVGQRFRLYPTDTQADQLKQAAGACRALYNAALEQRRTAYRSHGVTLNSFSQNADLTDLLHSGDFPWVGKFASRDSLKIALRDLDAAYSRFFKRLGGFPKFKRRGVSDSFKCSPGTYGFRRLNRRWAEVRVPKVGWIRLRLHAPIRGQLRSATFSRDAIGWHVSIAVNLTGAPPRAPRGGAVGIDRGVAASVATSDGDFVRIPAPSPGERQRLLRLERQKARQVRGSNRYHQTCTAIARLRARDARRRRAACHEITTSIARRYATIAIEDLKIANMTRSARGSIEEPGVNVRQKAGLNRAILAQGWGELARQLEYKTSWRGTTLVRVPAHFSSQTCSACGHVAAENRESQAIFACVNCGHERNADINAARVILARALDQEPAARIVVAARGGFGIGRPVKREGKGFAPRPPALPALVSAATAVDDNIDVHPTAARSR